MNKSQLKYNHFGSENLILPRFPTDNENEHPGYKQQVLIENLIKMKPLVDKTEKIMGNVQKKTENEDVNIPIPADNCDIEFGDWEMCDMETNIDDIKCNYDKKLKELIVKYNLKRIKLLEEINKPFHDQTRKGREQIIIRYQNEQSFKAIKKLNKQQSKETNENNVSLQEINKKMNELENKITTQNTKIENLVNENEQLKQSLSKIDIFRDKLTDVINLLPSTK
jgi:vacuolar-type H+-ATPase subunit I/STV1